MTEHNHSSIVKSPGLSVDAANPYRSQILCKSIIIWQSDTTDPCFMLEVLQAVFHVVERRYEVFVDGYELLRVFVTYIVLMLQSQDL